MPEVVSTGFAKIFSAHSRIYVVLGNVKSRKFRFGLKILFCQFSSAPAPVHSKPRAVRALCQVKSFATQSSSLAQSSCGQEHYFQGICA